jgi:Asp-tRNA(Asn)/Glu-tRNA(Gln) amidotransferase C subunit
MITAEDLVRLAKLAGLSVPSKDLERLAPLLETMYADLDRLRALPLDDMEPAFTPALGAIAPDQASAAR